MILFYNFLSVICFFGFIAVKIKYVIIPDITIVIMSNTESGKFPSGLNRKPLPRRNKFCFIITISPIYMTTVMNIAVTDGIMAENNFRFSYSHVPAYTPAVTPNTIKKIVIKKAEIGEMLISPVLKKAVKHAKIQRPIKIITEISCAISGFFLIKFCVCAIL